MNLMRVSCFLLRISPALFFGFFISPIYAQAEDRLTVAPAPILSTLDFSAELDWFALNDTGSFVAYAGDQLQVVDLLSSTPPPPKAIVVPGLGKHSLVVPVPATGLLLLPDVPGERSGEARRCLAVDTLAGKILWTGPSLGKLLEMELFLEAGVVVLRTQGASHGTTAVDLASGDILWQRDDVRLMWPEGERLGLLADGILTLAPRSGKLLRRVPLALDKEVTFYSFAEDGMLLLRKGRKFRGLVYPPFEESATGGTLHGTSLEEKWNFRAASPMVKACFKSGGCRVFRPGPGRLLVRSGHYELLDVHTGKVLWDRKRGLLRTTDLAFSPNGLLAAVATSKGLEVIDLQAGGTVHEIRYPEKLRGVKLSKSARFIDDEMAMTVFPDKKGEPRGLTAFSCAQGQALWALELPRSARYSLTSKEQSKLFARIALALVATAVSVSNPMSYGGSSYATVFAPNIDVRRLPGRLDAGSRSPGGGSYLDRHFPQAVERYRRLAPQLLRRRRASRYYVTGTKGKYEIQRINFRDGTLRSVARYVASPVHAIYPDTGFERAISLESNKTRLRVLSLERSTTELPSRE